MTGGQDERYPGPRPVTSVEPRLVILADDLTGACDAAVAFTTVCDPVRVQLNSESPEPNGVQATTTESRDLPAAYAEVRIRSIVERLPSNIELFKKIDSVFRGNTLAEIAATSRCARYDLAILAPCAQAPSISATSAEIEPSPSPNSSRSPVARSRSCLPIYLLTL